MIFYIIFFYNFMIWKWFLCEPLWCARVCMEDGFPSAFVCECWKVFIFYSSSFISALLSIVVIWRVRSRARISGWADGKIAVLQNKTMKIESGSVAFLLRVRRVFCLSTLACFVLVRLWRSYCACRVGLVGSYAFMNSLYRFFFGTILVIVCMIRVVLFWKK